MMTTSGLSSDALRSGVGHRARLADDLEVRVALERVPEPLTDQIVVIDQQHRRRVRTVASGAADYWTLSPGTSCRSDTLPRRGAAAEHNAHGRAARISARISRVGPYSLGPFGHDRHARSCRRPPGPPMPRPSSLTSTFAYGGSISQLTHRFAALACLRALVTASCAIRRSSDSIAAGRRAVDSSRLRCTRSPADGADRAGVVGDRAARARRGARRRVRSSKRREP